MKTEILFKALQRQSFFRNPNHITDLANCKAAQLLDRLSAVDLEAAKNYIDDLLKQNINYTYPGHENYPESFYKMQEPPFFLEYIGQPVWLSSSLFSVVGARKIHALTTQWMNTELSQFLQANDNLILVSGGAQGVDQQAHLLSIKIQRPTLVVLPCGINNLFPQNLNTLKKYILDSGGCFISEFENQQSVKKSFFYFRNRLIAGLSPMTLVAQSERKSGTFLTVHHALQNGKLILTVPSHPQMSEFSGNQYLIREGAFFVQDFHDLQLFWDAERWSGRVNEASQT